MINIKQLRYSKDNLAYILYMGREAAAIDPGCPDEIIDFLKGNNLTLTMILNTHSHYDHTLGNKYLEEKTGLILTEYEYLNNLKVGGYDLDVIHTSGHTADSVCFKTDDFIVTGDTLFIANVGNCQDSLITIFKDSLKKLLVLPNHLAVYPGHDYTERSLKRAGQIESGNKKITEFNKKYNPPPVFSTIGDEKNINPYLRTNTVEIIKHLNDRGKNTDTDIECFKSFMELY